MENRNNEQFFLDFLSHLTRLGYEDKEGVDKIKAAWKFASDAHFGQKRFSGDDYITHSLEVARIIASWKLDITSIIAGLLHDTVEDGAATDEDINKYFGEEVARLVDGVTKVSKLRLRGSDEENFVENLRKMFLAMAKDLRVVLVKLADRLHNMRTLEFIPEEKQKRIAKETLDVYAPLAERLGMGNVKAELNDLAFPYLFPEEYQRILSESKVHYKKTEEVIKKIKSSLLKEFAEEGIKPLINARKKSYYSLWKKLNRPGRDWDFDQIYDIVALRIIVDTVSECYSCLGIVHKHYKVFVGSQISDYISQPKPNGYRSLHTRIVGPGGRVVEIQIRTKEMQEEAEYGIAAHWAYSESKSKKSTDDETLQEEGVKVKNKLSWVKQLASWQSEIKDSKEFLEAVKFDALSERIFVFSPKGDVFDLPVDSTPVDFAYSVHTTLAQYLGGAKVNGKIVPLSHKLNSGDVVEIIKSKNPKTPNVDWLEFVKTRVAKSEIKKKTKR